MSHMRSIEVTTCQIFNGRTGDIKDLCHLIPKGTLPESWKNHFHFLVQSESWDVWKPSFETIKVLLIWIQASISPLLSNFLTNLTLTVQHFENSMVPENQKFSVFGIPNFSLNLSTIKIWKSRKIWKTPWFRWESLHCGTWLCESFVRHHTTPFFLF